MAWIQVRDDGPNRKTWVRTNMGMVVVTHGKPNECTIFIGSRGVFVNWDPVDLMDQIDAAEEET